jgi:hypothetical protein
MMAIGQIEVHTLSAPERRMLLEMLASERAGELALHVGHYGRIRVAASLTELAMAEWVADDEVVFTELGRWLAEALAERLVRRDGYQLAC